MSTGGVAVAFVQPSLRRYRMAFYEALARRLEGAVDLWADLHPRGGGVEDALPGLSGLRCHDAPVRRFGPVLLQPRMIEAASCPDADVVVLPWNVRCLHLPLALARIRARGAASLLWGHGVGKRESRLARWARNLVGRRGDGVVVYGRAAHARLVAERFEAERVFVAPNAVDQSSIREAVQAWGPDRLAAFRRSRGLDEGEWLVFVSRLIASKRVDLLVEAFGILHRRRPTARLAVVGGGAEIDRLRTMADAAAPGAVRFTGPIYGDDELAPWMLSSVVFAYPRSIGLSIFHAFGFGLPVVTCEAPGDHGPEFDLLEPGVNGLTFPDGDSRAMADRLDQLLGDPALRAGMSAAARATVSGPEGHDIPQMVEGFMRAIAAVRPSRG
jgi:glycosyltransferase involved in cell wall biosynthesis